MSRSWTVVKFTEENSVEAVPTSWILNNKCYWPSFQRDKVIAAIRKNQTPDLNWPLYEITIFRNSTYDNYMIARDKCKKAEDTSDLNSEVSAGEGKRKRIIKKRKISSCSEDESNYRFLPTPPLLRDNYKERKIDQEIAITDDARNNTYANSCSERSFSNSPSLIIRKINNIKDNYKGRENNEIDQQIAEIDDSRNNTFANSSSEESFPNSPSVIVKKSNHIKGKQVTARQDFNNNFACPEKENQFTNSMKCACKLCPAHIDMQSKNEIYFKEIIRQQNYFKAQLWQTSEDVRDLKINILNVANDRNQFQKQESVFCSFTLPLETEQQLEEVEQFLTNGANFETSVTQASRIGGKHSYEFVKRNLNRLLSNKLATKFSWFGRKLKKKFHELKLAEMLMAAGEAYNASFTRKDIEEATQKWLRRAKERADASEKKMANQIRVE